MSTAEFEMLTMVIAMFGAGTFTLIGLRMFLTYRAQRLGAGKGGGEQLAQLTETVEELRRDLADTRADLAEVHERVDFAERLLTKARDEGRVQPGP